MIVLNFCMMLLNFLRNFDRFNLILASSNPARGVSEIRDGEDL